MKLLHRNLSRRLPKKYSNLSLVGLLAILISGLSSTALAEINTTVLFQPPPESEQPESTESAASRQSGQCFQDLLTSQRQESSEGLAQLIPIVPINNFALTISDRPDFWVYLPETSAKQAILSIQEEDGNPHWQQQINLTEAAGIMNISLSKDAPVLDTDKNYQWAVILICGNRPNPNDPVVTSWIKRVNESQLVKSVNYATELDKAANYAKQGIWYDVLNILVTQKDT
ncbi:MAG: DUF928 domain-containing protein, partial [Bacteroidota bacterium]